MTRFVHECSEVIVECEIPEEQNIGNGLRAVYWTNAQPNFEAFRFFTKTAGRLQVMRQRQVRLAVLDGA